MKRFYETNTITYNLMSFSAFKSILIFSACLEGPKSYNELQKIIGSHPYMMNETVSIDSIRIYLNSLKKMGCKINRITKNRITKYYVEKHPFELNITNQQIESIIKIFRAISKEIDIDDYFALSRFFENFSKYIINDDIKGKLYSISPIKNIDTQLINELNKHAKNKNKITVLYKYANNSNPKEIHILADRLYIENGKLYLSGINSKYNNYSKFVVSKIIKITSVNPKNFKVNTSELVVEYIYERNGNSELELLPNEKVIKKTKDKLYIQICSKNKFDIIQRILYHADKCEVIFPDNFRNEIIACLKRMKEGYFD